MIIPLQGSYQRDLFKGVEVKMKRIRKIYNNLLILTEQIEQVYCFGSLFLLIILYPILFTIKAKGYLNAKDKGK